MVASRFHASFQNVRKGCLLSCLALIAGITMGCGGEQGPATYPVTGTVTFDGAPVEEGRIQFTPVSGARSFAAEIKNGQYSLESETGKMKVEITASRLIPGKFDTSNPDDEPQPVGEMYIPAKYNADTTLEAEITESGENKFDFALTAE
jgi:hypothetical protein